MNQIFDEPQVARLLERIRIGILDDGTDIRRCVILGPLELEPSF